MENKDKTYKTRTYKCGICGETYDSIQQRMNCEMTCFKKQQEEEKRLAAEKLRVEKVARFEEASKALENALTLVNKCVEDYGTFQYSGKLKDLEALNLDFFPSKLWHHFWY